MIFKESKKLVRCSVFISPKKHIRPCCEPFFYLFFPINFVKLIFSSLLHIASCVRATFCLHTLKKESPFHFFLTPIKLPLEIQCNFLKLLTYDLGTPERRRIQ